MAGLHQLQSNTSAITANALNTSQSSLFQHTSANTNFAAAGVSARVASFNGVSSNISLNAGNNLSLSQGTGASSTAFTFNVSGVLQTSQSSLFQHTSATSLIIANALLTSQSSLFQHTSNTSLITGNAFASSNSSNLMATGERANYQYTSNSSNNTSVYQALSATTKFAGTGTTFNGANISGSLTNNSNGLAMSLSVAAPGAAAENNNHSLLGNVVGNSTASGSTIAFIGGNNITLSGTNGSQIQIDGPSLTSLAGTGTSATNASITLNSNGLQISVANPGGGGFTASSTIFGERYQWQSTSSSMGQNTLHFIPLNVETPVSASNIILPVAITFSTSAASNGTVGHTMSYALYTRVASARSMLSTIMSSSYTMAGNMSSNVSMSYNVITSITASNGYGTKQSNSGGINNSADVHGIREIRMPFNMSLSQGEYWLAIGNSSSAAGTAGNLLRISHIGATSNVLQGMGVAIASNNANAFKDMGLGIYRTTTGAFPNTVSFSQIAQTNQIIPRIIMVNETM